MSIRSRSATACLALVIVCVGTMLRLRANDLDDLLTGYSLTSWNDDAGRSIGSVYSIVQDADLYLWIGTDDGLFRFDGSRFTAWDQLSDTPTRGSAVRSLLVDRSGSLWIGFANRAAVGMIRGRTLVRYEAGLDNLDAVTELVQDGRGVMWAIADRGLYRLQEERWVSVPLPWKTRDGQVLHPFVTRTGQLWLGTRWGVFQHDSSSDTFRLVTDDHVWGLSEDAAGNIWTTDIVAGFRPLGTAPPRHPLEGAGYRLLHDRDDNLWVATFGEGLWQVARDGARLTVKRAALRTGLSSDSVQSLMQDRDGNVWVGTTGGLHRLTKRKLAPIDNIGFVLVTEPAGDGWMWAGTTNGLLRLPATPQSPIRERIGTTAPDIRSLYTDPESGLWIGASDGLWRLLRGRIVKVPLPGRPQMLVRWLAPAGGGRLWLGDNEWLHLWDGARLRPFQAEGISPDETRVSFARADASGRVWVGFTGGRLGFIDRAGVFHDVGASQGLPPGTHRAIHAVFEDRTGVVWIGGSGGLSRYADGRVATLTRANGLPQDRVWTIVEDNGGRLWLNTDRGLVLLEHAEIDKALSNRSYRMFYRSFDTLDGVAGSAIGIIDSARAEDGTLWFVQGGGLTHVNPQRLIAEPDLPPGPIEIAAAVANDARVTPTANIVFPPGTRRLEIHYAAPTLTGANKVRFRYRLDGVDTSWIDAGTRRTAFYTNLEPRVYQFHVEASVEGSAWTTSPATWDFRIEPMFHQTRWFYALVGGAAALVVWGGYRGRLRLVKRQFALALAERARLSREIHDTLLQSLVGVALQVEAVAADLGPRSSPTRKQLLRIRRKVEAYIRDTRQSIWDLRSPQLEERDLAGALREFGRIAVTDTRIRFVVTTTGTARPCTPKVENQLLRIGQEAITNAVRHAHAARICLDLRFEPGGIRLRVSDDGCGFNPADVPETPDPHYGLMTMRERAEELHGELCITSTRRIRHDRRRDRAPARACPALWAARGCVMTRKIQVLCVDDHPIVREGIALIISRQRDMKVIGVAATGEEAIEQFAQHRPDITLMDLRLGSMSGLQAIQAIRRDYPDARIIVLTMYEGDEDIHQALASGAITYLLKDTLSDDLIRILREVHAGGHPIVPGVKARLAARASQPPLTAREVQVLTLVAQGRRNKEIGSLLGISEETVTVHLKNIFAKLKVNERTAAVNVALRRGIVHIE